MASDWEKRRPRLAVPTTIITESNVVRLVAGEDVRFTFRSPRLDEWLPQLIERFDGRTPLAVLVEPLPGDRRSDAIALVERLFGERVLVDGSAADAHQPGRYYVVFEGSERLFVSLERADGDLPLVVYCQDRLDYEAVLDCQRRCRAERTPMLWLSVAAMSRGFVSPLFLPDAGPCFGCLLGSFERLSPAPEIYEALRRHAQAGKAMAAAEFPSEGIDALQAIVRWKLAQAESALPDASLYRLHVLERGGFEIRSHRVFVDDDCPICGETI